MTELISLYTRQNEKSFNELKRTGCFTNKEIYVRLHMGVDADHFTDRYRYFVKMAEQLVPRPEGVEYPVWCTCSKRYCKQPVFGELVYALEVPREEILLFDGLRWDYVLNYQYCPLNSQDKERFDQVLADHGLSNVVNLFQWKYNNMYEDIKQEIIASWPRIFDLAHDDPAFIEGNIWQIKEEWVKHIIYPEEDFFEIVSDMEDIF